MRPKLYPGISAETIGALVASKALMWILGEILPTIHSKAVSNYQWEKLKRTTFPIKPSPEQGNILGLVSLDPRSAVQSIRQRSTP
jgi:hypothetical protein